MRYLLCLITAAALAATADANLTVDKLVAFVRSSIQMKDSDVQVADRLHHVKLTEKLDDQIIEDLQGGGAGPKTVAALKELAAASVKLDSPAPPQRKETAAGVKPGPDDEEQARIIGAARSYVMNYTKQLPNFICVEVVRRDADPTGTGQSWHHLDTDTIKLSYFEHHENYQVVLVNNQPTTSMTMEQLGGTVSQGEFGSLMKEVFEPDSHARFTWDHIGTLRGRPTYVFAYDIEQVNSKYRVTVEKTETIVPAYRGLVYIDKDTKMVTRITTVPYDMPVTFPIREIHGLLDYDFTKIGEAEFLLPSKASVTSKRSDNYLSRNDIQFTIYRKFGSDSTIKFDTPVDEKKQP
jgi:hypothetical protein